MALPNDGVYYIEDHATNTSITRGAAPALIVARVYSTPAPQQFRVIAVMGGYTIANVTDGSFVAANPAIGAQVVSQAGGDIWTITPVGNNHYSITKNTDGGPAAMQVVSYNTDVPINLGSYVGSDTQRWHFVPVPVPVVA